ncbi:hypothetical protein V5O48_015244 [Marasmius crinis-equi]|uniref:Uncharacterized protein n=1 Tax=Marasmius crinis-equi TaxID=585013 RepID=A0ABR3EV35_9AGAR
MFNGRVTDAELNAYILCVAQSQRSPDMQGYAVRLSTFIANVCIAILIVWSEKPVEESVGVMMLQVYSILLSTIISMARNKDGLSVADVHFALPLTMSPLSLYFVYSTYRFIRKRPSYLYDRIRSTRIITSILSIVMVLWWVAIDILIYFKDSECKVTFWGWVMYKLIEAGWTLFFAMPLIVLLPVFWAVYLIRHFRDIRGEYRRHMSKTRVGGRFRWVKVVARPIKVFLISQWDVITLSHRWLLFYTVLIFHVCWAGALIIWAVDMNKWFYEVIIMTFTDTTSHYVAKDFDPFSYGQLLAVAVAAQPVWSVSKLFLRKRENIRDWLLDWPQSMGNGIVFIVTGRRNPWKKRLKARALHQRAESFGGEKAVNGSIPLAVRLDYDAVKRSEVKIGPLERRYSTDEGSPGLVSWNHIDYPDQYPPPPRPVLHHRGGSSESSFSYRPQKGGFPPYGAIV